MAYLEIIKGNNPGTKLVLTDKSILGRSTDASLCIQETKVSREHAIVQHRAGHFELTDLGSSNGTMVNDKVLHRHVPQALYDNDEISIGNTLLRFVSEGAEPPGGHKKLPEEKVVQNGGLTMVFTEGTSLSLVSATLDVSAAQLLGMGDDKKNSSSHLQDTVKRLQAMVKVSQDLGAITKPENLFEKIMHSIFDMFPGADRAYIMLRDNVSGELVPITGRYRETCALVTSEFPISRTIIKTVVEKKQSILLADAQKDRRFKTKDSVVDLSIRSLMCAPFICQNELLGLISVDTISNHSAFSADDLSMLTGIAGQVAIAIKNAELYTAVEKETQTRTQLSRYLSPDVVEGVLDGTIPFTIGGERKYGTVLFCDIVGFSAIAENLEALGVVELLNRYFRITTEIITRHKGTLHKFGGDMIMAFWNVMLKDDNAQLHSIRASLEMQAAVYKFGRELEAGGQPEIVVGIGCNTGGFAGGNIGGVDRMEYTVIGDNVNLAQRIESLASRWQVFVAQDTYAPAAKNCVAVKLPSATVKGRMLPVDVFSIRGVALNDTTMLLAIPVRMQITENSAVHNGYLCKWDSASGTSTLIVPQAVLCHDDDTVTCSFNCFELSQVPNFTAVVEKCEEDSDNPFCKKITLVNIEGDEARAFFVPGTVMETKKSWEEMERH
jgi:class 3 adenylate cyclase